MKCALQKKASPGAFVGPRTIPLVACLEADFGVEVCQKEADLPLGCETIENGCCASESS